MFQSEKNMTFIMILVPFVWALSGISAKYLSFYIGADEIVVYRFFLSVLSTIPLLIWMKIPIKISLFNLVLSLVIAIFMIINYRFYFMGMQRGAAGLGAALVTVLIPIFVYIFMIFSKKSKPLIKDWAALLVGTIGVLLMMNFDQSNLALLISGGNLYFVLAALAYAAVTIVGAYMKNMHVLAFNFYISLFGFMIDWVYSYDTSLLVTLMDMDYIFWINILFVSVVAGTAITAVYYTGIRVIGSKKTSVFSLLSPFFAIAFGAIFFQEALNLKNIIGIIMAFVYSYDASLLVTLMEMDYIFWINILFVSVIAGTAIGSLYYAGIRIIGSKKTSVFTLLTPFFAITFGSIFFQEVLNLQNIIGIILAVSALFVLIDLKINITFPFR